MGPWREDWGTWRESSGDRRYLRGADGVWRYGLGQGERVGLPVIGAVDLTLAELATPVVGESQRREPRGVWDDGLPYGMEPDGLYLSLQEVRRRPELGELGDTRRVYDWASHVDWIAIDKREWQQLQTRVIGIRAPELANSGYASALAEAQRDVLVARRRRADRARVRREAAASLAAAGATRGQLARVLHVSRERVHQLVRLETQDQRARSSDTVDWRTLGSADAEWRRSCIQLTLTLNTRRQRVLTASRHFHMGLGQIGDILGISRSQAQQLRNAARSGAPTPRVSARPLVT